MKKEYTKPAMEIVSFKTENLITASTLTIGDDYQTSSNIYTINY